MKWTNIANQYVGNTTVGCTGPTCENLVSAIIDADLKIFLIYVMHLIKSEFLLKKTFIFPHTSEQLSWQPFGAANFQHFMVNVSCPKSAWTRRICKTKAFINCRILTHRIPLHNINCAHLGAGPLLKFNGLVY